MNAFETSFVGDSSSSFLQTASSQRFARNFRACDGVISRWSIAKSRGWATSKEID